MILAAIALAMTGVAAMGMEILWFRHFLILLGGFRAVFSLLLAVILTGIGIGSLAGGFLHRRTGRPAERFMVVQALLVVFTLIGFAMADVRAVDAAAGAAERALAGSPGLIGTLQELWFNARPMLVEVAVPALLMGFSFPLANAIIQRAEQSVGRRAGVLYLANTAGAVVGSLATGFVLLPALGLQQSATILMAIATLAVVPLYFAVTGAVTDRLKPAPTAKPALISKPDPTAKPALTSKPDPTAKPAATAKPDPTAKPAATSALGATPSDVGATPSDVGATPSDVGAGFSRPSTAFIGSLVVGVGSLALWLMLPSDYVIARALGLPKGNERVLTIDDGLTEVIAVTEVPGGRTLVTNGHAMSATLPLSQRYMRSLVHIPLLSMDSPESVLVIGFGVGNSTQSATLHPTVTRVDLADLSRDILAHAGYFADNRNVLRDPKVTVHINDGRQHLQMQPPASYDLITLEPPPIAYAGVGALYSREFYELARTRLEPRGYISQWLPAYQVPPETTLAMVRAFIDVFPQAVLLSGAESDLILLGTTDSRIEIDPVNVALAMARAPAVRTDLERIDLGTPREIVGTFVGSSRTLAEATRDVAPVTDDRPMQEYGVRSMLNFFKGVPASVVDLGDVATWCPRCFVNGAPVPAVQGLDTYLELMSLAYAASPAEVAQAKRLAYTEGRFIAGSAYLGEIVPETAAVHNVLGIDLASRGQLAEAVVEFRRALALDPNDAATLWHLGAALASTGDDEEALAHLRRSAELDPTNAQVRNDLDVMLQRQR